MGSSSAATDGALLAASKLDCADMWGLLLPRMITQRVRPDLVRTCASVVSRLPGTAFTTAVQPGPGVVGKSCRLRLTSVAFRHRKGGSHAHRGAMVAGVRRKSSPCHQQNHALDLCAHHRRQPDRPDVVAADAAVVAGG